jgi:hypothetical protein
MLNVADSYLESSEGIPVVFVFRIGSKFETNSDFLAFVLEILVVELVLSSIIHV